MGDLLLVEDVLAVRGSGVGGLGDSLLPLGAVAGKFVSGGVWVQEQRLMVWRHIVGGWI